MYSRMLCTCNYLHYVLAQDKKIYKCYTKLQATSEERS